MSEEKRIDLIKNGIRSRIRQVQNVLLQEIKELVDFDTDLLEYDIEVKVSEGRLFIPVVQEILNDAVLNINELFDDVEQFYQFLSEEPENEKSTFSSSEILAEFRHGDKKEMAKEWGFANPYATRQEWIDYGTVALGNHNTANTYYSQYVVDAQKTARKVIAAQPKN